MIEERVLIPAPPALSYSRRDQAQYVAVITLASLTLGLARILQPSPAGLGTHQQLGLPPCFFHRLTGIPWPSCGLTTSFAHTVRFHFYDALITQPFGLIACLATMLVIPLCGYLMHRRVPWLKLLTMRGSDLVMYLGLAFFVAGWIYKIIVTR